ncbi:MAG: PAS domain S-box protein, partial [Opitutaceae bacterium]
VHRPAARVREAVQAFAAGDPAARVTGVNHAEFARLADAVNQALASTCQAQDQLRVMTESAPTGIFSLDERGGCLATNERWREVTGLDAEQALGHGWLRAVHPEDRDQVRAVWDSPVSSRGAGPLYHRLLRPDGTERWVIRTLTPLHDTAGRFTGFIGNLSDITELRTLQDRLRGSEQQRLLFESMPQGVLIYDGTGRVIEANPSAERFLGFSREELLCGEHRSSIAYGPFREDGTFIPVEERPSHVALREQREVRDVVVGFIPRLGTRLSWYRVNAVPLFAGRNGGDARVYFTMEDITGIRAAQEALRRSESRYQDLVENLPDLIFETNPAGMLTYVNRTWRQVTGFEPDRLLGRPWWHLEPAPGDGGRRAGEDAAARLIAEREINGLERDWKAEAGATISVVVNARAVTGPKGEITGFRGVAYDVTQRKAMLALLAESQERFASFFDNAADAMVVSSDQGVILEVNAATCRLLGRTREELIGRGRDAIIDV